MYAIMDINGKQYKASAGQTLLIDRVDDVPGTTLEFDNVLFVSGDKDIKVGTPTVANVKIVAEVLEEVKDKKIISFKYKRRKSSSRKMGHRQKYTKVEIKEIINT